MKCEVVTAGRSCERQAVWLASGEGFKPTCCCGECRHSIALYSRYAVRFEKLEESAVEVGVVLGCSMVVLGVVLYVVVLLVDIFCPAW